MTGFGLHLVFVVVFVLVMLLMIIMIIMIFVIIVVLFALVVVLFALVVVFIFVVVLILVVMLILVVVLFTLFVVIMVVVIVTSGLDLEIGVGVIDGAACRLGKGEQGREIRQLSECVGNGLLLSISLRVALEANNIRCGRFEGGERTAIINNQLQPLLRAGCFCCSHDIGNAVLMIMRLENLAGFDSSAQGQGSTDNAPRKGSQAEELTLIFCGHSSIFAML